MTVGMDSAMAVDTVGRDLIATAEKCVAPERRSTTSAQVQSCDERRMTSANGNRGTIQARYQRDAMFRLPP